MCSLTNCREAAPVLAGTLASHSCGCSSVGRARPCQGRGQGFEPPLPLHFGCALAPPSARSRGNGTAGCARGSTPCAARAPGQLADHSRMDTAEVDIRPSSSVGSSSRLVSGRSRVRIVAWGTTRFMSCSSRWPRIPDLHSGDTGSTPVHDARSRGGGAWPSPQVSYA